MIIFLINTSRYSGAEKFAQTLLENLPNEVEVYCSLDHEKYGFKLQNKIIHQNKYMEPLDRINKREIEWVKTLLKNLVFLNSILISKLIMNTKVIVVANNYPLSIYLIPTLIMRLFGVKFFWIDYNISTHDKFLGKIAAKTCYYLYNHTFVVSEAVKKKYFRHKKTSILYNGIDCKIYNFDQRTRDELRILYGLNKKVIVGFFGVFSLEKGIDILLEAFRSLVSTFTNLHLLIIGRFSDRESNNKMFKSISMINKDHLTLMNWTNEIMRFYSVIDVLVNATRKEHSEPLGMTILEAMACKRVVLATETGGTPEIIEDGINGFLCSPNSVISLTRKLEHILLNINSLDLLRNNARKTILNKFNIDDGIKVFLKTIL